MLERERFDDYQARGNEDMLALFTGDDLSRLSGRLLEMGGKVVGIKCGYRGVHVRTAGEERLAEMGKVKPADLANWAHRELWQPSFHVEHYAGGTGSGDSCIAGFLSGFLRGYSLEETVRYGCAAGGFNVTAPGALTGLRPWPQIVAKVRSGWERNPLQVEGDGWICDGSGLWHGPHDCC